MNQFTFEVEVANCHKMIDVITWLRERKIVHVQVCPVGISDGYVFKHHLTGKTYSTPAKNSPFVRRVIKFTNGNDAMLFKLTFG